MRRWFNWPDRGSRPLSAGFSGDRSGDGASAPDGTPAPPASAYDVFISYRHAGFDGEIAALLHRRLEAFRTPKALVRGGLPRQLNRVFRDQDEFAASSDLSVSIREALTGSRFMVVVCSPRAPGSTWVAQEIQEFRALHGADQILALLIEGEPLESFPPALYAAHVADDGPTSEPLAADIRAPSRRRTRHVLKVEILRILAPVLGCTFDALRQRQHERARRRLMLFAAASCCLTVILAGLAGFALLKQIAAREAEGVATQRLAAAQINQSKFLADSAQRQLAADKVDLGISLALAALPRNLSAPDRPPVKEAVAAMIHGFHADRLRAEMAGHTDYISGLDINPGGTLIATASGDRTARLWLAATGAELHVLAGHLSTVRSVEFSPDGQRVLTASDDATARIWDTATGREMVRFVGHTAGIWKAHFDATGQRVITAGWDRTARIWNAADGSQTAVLTGHTDYLLDAVFTPDGARAVTISHDKTARVWDTATGAGTAVLKGHEGPVDSVTISPDGTRVLTGGLDRTGRLWNIATGQPIRTFGGGNFTLYSVKSASFSPDGRYLAAATEYQTARIWDVETGGLARILSGHLGWVNKIAYSPDGTTIATGSTDFTTRLWDARTGDAIGALNGHRNGITQLVWSRDSKQLVTGSLDRTARLWDARADHQRLVLGHTTYVSSAHFSPDGTMIASASSDQTARVWDARTGQTLGVLAGHSGRVDDAIFSPSGRGLATSSTDGTVRLWNIPDSTPTHVLMVGSPVSGIAFSPDGTRIAAWSPDKTVRVWDVASGAEITRLTGHTGPVQFAEWSPDGTRIVTASEDQTARLFDAATGRQRAVLTGHTGSLNTASFSHDGKRIVTSGWDKSSRMWDADNGALLRDLASEDIVMQAWFSPDDTKIVTASLDGFVRVWNSITGEKLSSIQDDAAVGSARFSPDGSRLVTVNLRFVARVWDVATGAEIATVRRHRGPLHAVDFSPDGTRILTSSDDGTIRVFDAPAVIDAASALLVSRARTVHSLSAAERRDFFLEEDLFAAAVKERDVNPCDRLAAHPFDPLRTTRGVSLQAMDARAAIEQCDIAVRSEPRTPRYRYQLGRALEAAQRLDEALARYQEATGAGYPVAFMNLGLLYLNGRGVGRDPVKAAELFRTAVAGNVVMAGNLLATALSKSPDPTTRDEANRIWSEAAGKGDPYATMHIAKMADLAATDPAAAFRSYAIAEWLLGTVGDPDQAALAAARRTALARSLPAEVVAGIWAEVQARQAGPAMRP